MIFLLLFFSSSGGRPHEKNEEDDRAAESWARLVMPRNTNNAKNRTQWCQPPGSQDKETLKRVMRCLLTRDNSTTCRADLCSLVDCDCNDYLRGCDTCVSGSAWKTMVALWFRSKVQQQCWTRGLESTLFHWKIIMTIIIIIIIIIIIMIIPTWLSMSKIKRCRCFAQSH